MASKLQKQVVLPRRQAVADDHDRLTSRPGFETLLTRRRIDLGLILVRRITLIPIAWRLFLKKLSIKYEGHSLIALQWKRNAI